MIACSACGSQLKVGIATCPRCNLPITAQAVRVQPRRMSTLSLVLLSLLGITVASIAIGSIADKVSAPKREAAHAALLADLNSGKLSDPQAFQSRCGNALSVTERKEGKALTYSHGDILVKLAPGQPAQFYSVRAVESHGAFHNYEMPVGAAFALPYLSCEQTR